MVKSSFPSKRTKKPDNDHTCFAGVPGAPPLPNRPGGRRSKDGTRSGGANAGSVGGGAGGKGKVKGGGKGSHRHNRSVSVSSGDSDVDQVGSLKQFYSLLAVRAVKTIVNLHGGQVSNDPSLGKILVVSYVPCSKSLVSRAEPKLKNN